MAPYGAIFSENGTMSAIWHHLVAMSKFITIYFLFKLVYGAIFTKMAPYGASAILAPYGAENGAIAIWRHLNGVIAIWRHFTWRHRHMAPFNMKSFRKLSRTMSDHIG